MAQAHAFKEELRFLETLEWLVTKKQITQEQADALKPQRKKASTYHAWIGINPPPQYDDHARANRHPLTLPRLRDGSGAKHRRGASPPPAYPSQGE